MQEIDEGLTKPVEKPIPKPLPPTVCLDSSPETPLISPVQSSASTKVGVITTPTSDELVVNTGNVNKKSIRNEDEGEKDDVEEGVECNSSPIDHSKINQISPTNTSQTSSQRVPSKSSATPSISPTSSNSPATSNYKRFKSFHNSANTSQYNRSSYYQPNRFNKPPQSHLIPPHYASHIPPGSINLTTVQSYYPPQVAPSYYYNTQMQTTNYYTNNMVPYGVYPTDYTLYTTNQHQQSINVAQEGYTPQPINSSSSIANVKQEPYEPTAASSLNEHNQEWNPYFKNPIPFKQEPSEPELNNSMETSSSTNNAANNQDNAITIVSQLLKDKQILNQLEKVAQTFRLN